MQCSRTSIPDFEIRFLCQFEIISQHNIEESIMKVKYKYFFVLPMYEDFNYHLYSFILYFYFSFILLLIREITGS